MMMDTEIEVYGDCNPVRGISPPPDFNSLSVNITTIVMPITPGDPWARR